MTARTAKKLVTNSLLQKPRSVCLVGDSGGIDSFVLSHQFHSQDALASSLISLLFVAICQ